MTLALSVVRKTILAEHEVIKNKLEVMEKLIAQVNEPVLRDVFAEFYTLFLKHLASEEKLLVPALTDVDSWGPIRAEKLNQEHKQQIKAIKDLKSRVQGKSFSEYKKDLTEFIQSIYEDMKHEEADFLSPDLLKDDTVTSGH